jgi:ferredoxin
MLKRSADRKVTNLVSPNGKTAKIANSFGLPSGQAFSCPGATSVCEKVCYAGKLEKIYSGVKNVLLHNWDALRNATLDEMVALLDAMIHEFRLDCEKAEKKGNVVPRDFRIHWDGDFFSLDYAQAWANVIVNNVDINFWVYTRSFVSALNVLPIFDGIAKDNLALYLSVDRANMEEAKAARKAFSWAKWAFLSETFADGKAEMAANGAEGKSYNCPENGGRIPLISTKGSACIQCGICPDGRGDVLFSIRKR